MSELTLQKLDELIDAVDENQLRYIICNYRQLDSIMKANGVSYLVRKFYILKFRMMDLIWGKNE